MEILAFAALLGLIPAAIASSKGRSFFVWWVYGALLFLIALIHAIVMKSESEKLEEDSNVNASVMERIPCPHCSRLLLRNSVHCRFCSQSVDGLLESELTPARLESIDTKDCRYCAETIKAAAILCRYCGRDVEVNL